jgi:hypothetical protein
MLAYWTFYVPTFSSLVVSPSLIVGLFLFVRPSLLVSSSLFVGPPLIVRPFLIFRSALV